MKTANPFIPTVSLMMVPSRSSRERFKVAVYSVLGVHLAFLLLLLAQGYKTDATTITIPAGEPADSPTSLTDRTMATEQKPVPTFAGSPSLSSPAEGAPATQPAAAGNQGAPTATAEAIHTVKAGETLSGIARAYGTNIKAIKAANRFKDERLAVGMKLRIPDNRLLAAAAR